MAPPTEERPRDPNAALGRALDVLACPLCGGTFDPLDHAGVPGAALRCGRGHAFDIARQGYASLTTGGGPHLTGDTAEMVAARTAFLSTGHYRPIADAIAAFAPATGWAVELAGGTGYYTSRVLDAAPTLEAVTIDISKHAARAAARSHLRLASATGDARATLPLRTGSVDLLLSVFGPRRGDEVARVLAPGGSAMVVTPRPGHLTQLRERFSLLAIGADKEARLGVAMAPLELGEAVEVEYEAALSRLDVVNAIMMGPNAFHQGRAEVERLAAGLPELLQTTVSVTVSRFGAAAEPRRRGIRP